MRAGATESYIGDKSGNPTPLRKTRARIVTFRVSGDEFDSLAGACRSSGARSLSGFAREAVLDKIQTMQAPATSLSGDLTTLTRALAQLDEALASARKKIRHILGPGAGVSGEEKTESR